MHASVVKNLGGNPAIMNILFKTRLNFIKFGNTSAVT